ncbi:MAG: hypothetical protein EAZ95_17020 [Bacteroidetes bacterium]|nr:MAG: hypothetical protein EAZ95_17020 [Bacteroidota bacterium]
MEAFCVKNRAYLAFNHFLTFEGLFQRFEGLFGKKRWQLSRFLLEKSGNYTKKNKKVATFWQLYSSFLHKSLYLSFCQIISHKTLKINGLSLKHLTIISVILLKH